MSEATTTVRSILNLRERHRQVIAERMKGNNGLRFLDQLCMQPLISLQLVEEQL